MVECSRCGNKQFNDRIGPQPRCEECWAFMAYSDEETVLEFYRDMAP